MKVVILILHNLAAKCLTWRVQEKKDFVPFVFCVLRNVLDFSLAVMSKNNQLYWLQTNRFFWLEKASKYK